MIKISTFNSGEYCIKYILKNVDPFTKEPIVVDFEYETDADIVKLGCIIQCIEQQIHLPTITLNMPYFPHSRMDRVMDKTTAFSLKIICNFINTMSSIKTINTFDLHSDVAHDLLNAKLINTMPDIDLSGVDFIVSPDNGSVKRCKLLGKDVICATKNRSKTLKHNPVIYSTIIEPLFIVPDNSTLLVVDDICDGGGTFMMLGGALRMKYPTCKLELFVTHGFFSKGTEKLEKIFSKVHCAFDYRED